MKAGDIVFSRDNSLISKVVRYFDGNSKYSHCCIAVSENKVLEAQYFKRSKVVPFYFTDYEIIDLGLSDSQRKQIQELTPALIGHRYDYIQIISYFIRDIVGRKFRIVNSPTNYICSEIVEIILQNIGVIPNNKKLRNLTPNELYRYLTSLK
jgi:hypothetical protein